MKQNDENTQVQRGPDGRWLPGTPSPSPGRPIGSRHKLTEDILTGIQRAWREHGDVALDRVARDEPAKFLDACVRLVPKDVQVSLQQRLPGGLDADDWNVMMGVVTAVKAALPDANQRQPSAVMAYVLDALRSHDAKLIEQ